MNNYYIVVTPFFPSPTRWQGAYILDQVKAIKRHSSYEVVVFKTHSLNDSEHDYEIDGIKVYCIRPWLMPSYILNGLTSGIVGAQFISMLKKYGIASTDIAFIHCHTVNHAALGIAVKDKNPRAKVILQFHDLDPLTLRNGKWANERWNRRFRYRRSVAAIEQVDLLVCISSHVKDVLTSFPLPRKEEVYAPALSMYFQLNGLSKIKLPKTYVLHNGVDTTIFNHNIIRNRELFRIGCVANFQDLKDHQSLVEAFHMLINKGFTNFRLSLLGSGETRGEIERYLIHHNISQYVEWPKEISHDKLPEYYNTLDLFVLPSRFEGFGCVYTEAYACGVPFICCENQGASECVAEEERELWLVRDQDVAHLAELIERQYLERNTQHLCKEYDIDKLIPPFLEYIQNI